MDWKKELEFSKIIMICHAFSILFNPNAYQITNSCSSGYVVETSDSPKRKVTMDISLHDQQCVYMLKIKITRHQRYAAHHKHLMAEPLVVKTDFFFGSTLNSYQIRKFYIRRIISIYACIYVCEFFDDKKNSVVYVYNRSRLYVYS